MYVKSEFHFTIIRIHGLDHRQMQYKISVCYVYTHVQSRALDTMDIKILKVKIVYNNAAVVRNF